MDDPAARRAREDPLNYLAGGAFALALMFALTSVFLPEWLVSETAGKLSIGLLTTCLELEGREKVCYSPQQVSNEWILSFMLIVIGIIGLAIATIACVVGLFKSPYLSMTVARFSGLVAIIFFNIAQIIFPAAFGQDQIGGHPYQLPQNFGTGPSYICFFISHWLAVVSELCAAKICRPRWQF